MCLLNNPELGIRIQTRLIVDKYSPAMRHDLDSRIIPVYRANASVEDLTDHVSIGLCIIPYTI